MRLLIEEGMKYIFRSFFLAKRTFRHLPDGRVWKATFSGCALKDGH